MTCNNRTTKNSDERFLAQQEHRQISRLWKKAIDKMSSSKINLEDEYEDADGGRRGVHFDQSDSQFECEKFCDSDEERKKFPSETIQKKLIKGKSVPKIKSPLQKFDEIVTRELTSRRMSSEGGVPSFEGSKKWSSLQFTGITDFGRSKISAENKVSRGALHGVETEVREENPSDVKNAALMDAIEKLAQAQAFCRFDAAVKAAEAATASVPPEMAEEAAMACAKDYQSEIVDVINEKIPLTEEKKPIEVIGYIGKFRCEHTPYRDGQSNVKENGTYKGIEWKNEVCFVSVFFEEKPERKETSEASPLVPQVTADATAVQSAEKD